MKRVVLASSSTSSGGEASSSDSGDESSSTTCSKHRMCKHVPSMPAIRNLSWNQLQSLEVEGHWSSFLEMFFLINLLFKNGGYIESFFNLHLRLWEQNSLPAPWQRPSTNINGFEEALLQIQLQKEIVIENGHCYVCGILVCIQDCPG